MKTSICENDRSGAFLVCRQALFCFFSKKERERRVYLSTQLDRHTPLGIRPKYNLKPKLIMIKTIESEGNN
jgi:hypothetical protein